MSKTGRPDFKKPSAWFHTVDELYTSRLDYLVCFAKKHLYQRDSAIDVVHDALVKSIEYFSKNKDKKVYQRIVEYQILKLCKKHNKYSSVEKPSGLMTTDFGDEVDD